MRVCICVMCVYLCGVGPSMCVYVCGNLTGPFMLYGLGAT